MAQVERDKAEAFKRLAETRLDKIRNDMKLIRNIANPYNYDFTNEQLDKIVADIKAMVQQTEDFFAEVAKKKKPGVRGPRTASTETSSAVSAASTIVSEQIKSEPEPEIELSPEQKLAPGEDIDDSDVPDFIKKTA